MDERTVLVINGPNLNLLGEREPEVYGHATLADLEDGCQVAAAALGLTADCRQSNHEGALIDWVQDGRRDAVSACRVPVVEGHISDIHAREPFRRHSYLTDVTAHQVIGRGIDGYAEAITWLGEQR